MSRGKSAGRVSRSNNKLALSRTQRRPRFESLETRQLLSITLPTIADQTVLAGAPLNLGLDATSSTSNAVNYTVSVTNSSLTATVPQGNPSLKLTVDYAGDPANSSDDIHGTMVFQLSKDLTPNTVEEIKSLVNADFYKGLTFHRIIKDFMIQGGDPNRDGTGGPGFKFDDEFNAALQFTSPGLLAMANSGEDTNGSQFFITTDPTRWLDFNHTIFGVLTEGSDVLAKLNLVPTDANSEPTYSVTISAAQIITDTQNGVLRLSAPTGATGSATVTVTATDSVTNDTTSQTFNVTIAADTVVNAAFLNTIQPIEASPGTPVTFDIPITNVDGATVTYAGSVISNTSDLAMSVDPSTGKVTLTPSKDLKPGVYEIQLSVTTPDALKANPNDPSPVDSQAVPVYINPVAPTSLVLTAASDTGNSNSDRLTGLNNTTNNTLQFLVNDVLSGATVQVFSDNVLIGSAVASGTSVTVTTNGTTKLTDGTHSITAKQILTSQAVNVGNLSTTKDLTSVASSALSITVDSTIPTGILLSNSSVTEGLDAGATVGTLSTTAVTSGGTYTYELIHGAGDADYNMFEIDGNILTTKAKFNSAIQSLYSIRVKSTETTSGQTMEKILAIAVTPVTPVNQNPSGISLSSMYVLEKQAAGATVGTFTTTDPDANDTFTYTLVTGSVAKNSVDNGSFKISGSTLMTNAKFDWATKNSYKICVRTTDAGGLSHEENFVITVTKATTTITLSNNKVAEDAKIDDTIGILTTTDLDLGTPATGTDPAVPATFTYDFVNGTGDTDNNSFTIDASGNLKTNITLDYETKTSYSVRIRATSKPGGLTFDKQFDIKVTDANEAPTDITLSNNQAFQDAPVGTQVGTFSATDPDSNNTFTYTLIKGDEGSGVDNTGFSISGNALITTGESLSVGTHKIRVKCLDQGGLSTDKTFTITVTGNTGPTKVFLSSLEVAEGQPTGTVVGLLSNNDTGDTATYTLVSGEGSADNAAFTISGNTLKTAAAFNYATQSSFTIRVRSTDQGGLWKEQSFTINVTKMTGPTDITLSANEIAEKSAVGTPIGTLTPTYPDAAVGTTYSYAFVSGSGATDNASFSIVKIKNEDSGVDEYKLQTKVVPDYKLQVSYSVRIRCTATWQTGIAPNQETHTASIDKTFTIKVIDVPDITEPGVLEAGATTKNGTLETKEKLVLEWRVTSSNILASLVATVKNQSTGAETALSTIGYNSSTGMYYSTFGPLEAGAYTYSIQVTDTKGGVGTYDGGTFNVVAATGPTISSPAVGEAQYVNGKLDPSDKIAITWGLSSDNGLSWQSLKVDGQAISKINGPYASGKGGLSYYSGVAGAMAAGRHTYTVEAMDARGVTSTYSGTFDVLATSTNQQGPTVSGAMVIEATGTRDGILTSSESLAMTFHAFDADGVASAAVTLDGNNVSAVYGPYAAASGSNFGVNFGTLSAGSHSYSIVARDKAGNASTAYTGSFTVTAAAVTDTGPTISGVMVIESTGPRDGVLTSNESLAMTFNAYDAGGVASATVLVDGQNVSAVYGPYAAASGSNFGAALGTLSAGTHTYSIVARDRAGNATSPAYTGSFSVTQATTTTTAPTIAGVVVVPSQGVITWNAAAASGMARVGLTVDGVTVTKLYGPYAAATGANYSGLFGKLAAGDHSYVITATDIAGKTTQLPGTFKVSAALTVDASVAPEGTATQLTDAELAPIVAEAIKRLELVLGVKASEALAGVSVQLADLSTGLLGEATDKVIRIDRDAAGYGWFVDSTPADDAEFVATLNAQDLVARKDGPAAQRVDLLTAVMHEMGHVIGYDHACSLDLMEATLAAGERKEITKS